MGRGTPKIARLSLRYGASQILWEIPPGSAVCSLRVPNVTALGRRPGLSFGNSLRWGDL